MLDDSYDEVEEEELFDVKNRYFSFYIDREEYAIPISFVEEIICYQELTHVPETKPFIVGALNLRGKVIAIMDVRLKLGMPAHPVSEESCIVVVSHREALLGMLVDRVSEVHDMLPEQIDSTLDNKDKEYVSKVGKVGLRTKFILNLDQLLFDESPVHSVSLT
jgi:purine-binding chemotaxis protein CheW